jgi:hypothetical protein
MIIGFLLGQLSLWFYLRQIEQLNKELDKDKHDGPGNSTQ